MVLRVTKYGENGENNGEANLSSVDTLHSRCQPNGHAYTAKELLSPTANPSPTVVSAPDPTIATVALPTVTPDAPLRLLLTNSTGYHITRLDPASGQSEQLEVGGAPWGIALSPDHSLAYVATAEGVAIVDLAVWQRTALITAYAALVGEVQFGEYRPGGMGIAVAPDGSAVYVGVYLGGTNSELQILDASRKVWEVTGLSSHQNRETYRSPDVVQNPAMELARIARPIRRLGVHGRLALIST